MLLATLQLLALFPTMEDPAVVFSLTEVFIGAGVGETHLQLFSANALNGILEIVPNEEHRLLAPSAPDVIVQASQGSQDEDIKSLSAAFAKYCISKAPPDPEMFRKITPEKIAELSAAIADARPKADPRWAEEDQSDAMPAASHIILQQLEEKLSRHQSLAAFLVTGSEALWGTSGWGVMEDIERMVALRSLRSLHVQSDELVSGFITQSLRNKKDFYEKVCFRYG